MTKNILPVLLFISLILLINIPASAGQDSSQRVLQVDGKGGIKVKPDVAYINISIVTRSNKAEIAIKKNAKKTTKVLNKIKSLIEKDDSVKTSNFNLSPEYKYNRTTLESVLTGYYTASNELTVETKNLNELGNLIDATVALGANRINGPWFDISNREDYERLALKGPSCRKHKKKLPTL